MMLEVVYLPSTFAVPGAIPRRSFSFAPFFASTKEVVFKEKGLTLPAAGRSPCTELGEIITAHQSPAAGGGAGTGRKM